MTKTILSASRPTLLRLPSYHSLLKKMLADGLETVSCTPIAQQLRLDATQVRKDFASTGIVGKPKVGYQVRELMEAIENFLGWNNRSDAFLVGAGNLGAALLGYDGFREYGLNIVAAFDTDAEKIGTTMHGKQVLPLEKLPDLAERLHATIGIITVPAAAAQSVATLIVLSGMKAIWNLTAAHLEVPESIIVENVRLSESLSVLSNRLTEAFRSER